MFIVKLQDGLYLAEWAGDPGRTCCRWLAREYKTKVGAAIALGMARRFRPFKGARILGPREGGAK